MKRTLDGKPTRFLLAPLLLAAALAGTSVLRAKTEYQNSSNTKPAAGGPAGQYTGPGSCSSTSCHGSIAPRTDNRVKQNEYSVWIVRDKHSKAYAALTGMVGERMATILGIGKAETAPKCLACHALDVPVSERAHTFEMTDGVSCENCHGPASGWLGRHTERDWKHEESIKLGMYDTRNIIKRTEKCLTCHLGNDQKFVDHEMIAAGHPDLYFELDSFSAQMPRHWKEPGEPGEPEGTDPWYDVREWGAGQAVQLQQALLHLASRSRGKIWPEFSELECYACHHSLTQPEQSWRQARGYPGRRAGDPPWNASRYLVFRVLARQVDATTAQKLDSELTRVQKLMSELNPNREQVASAAESSARVAGELAQKINSLPFDPALTMHLLQQISSDSDNISAQDEHAAAQAAMAIQSLFVACDRNQKLQNSPELRAAIGGLFQQLEIPSNYDPNRFSRQMKQVNSLLH
ncbi:MAG: multiheme c-type cytochrome [Candidatus Acidiferrales bacterium]